ncbi:uncharacterized protein LOC129743175 [Uranotaenia lowii]|uniref:uncharacterized protein LOC129743175 n=1 Tax=Uranotaenia lowii TaxID=190385 RepID=UPI002479E6BA|nr:uncharacterized protein LOC129743175 [Uranotaenia lowii]
MVMQQLWILPCGWDDPVPESLQEKWRNYCQDLPKISAFRVQRYAFLPNSKVQLHTFTDASEAAYGACVYARCADSKGNVRVQLLVSKSRLAPLKKSNIARLELCAAALGAHLYDHVKRALDLEIEASHFWTDSTVTLHWLKAPPHNWKTYVANRVAEVHHHTQGSQWRHVPGTDNPADFVSRGMTIDELLRSECWNNGPNCRSLTIDELRIAKIRLTRLAQEDAFSDEIRELEKGKNVSRKSSIRLLNPILDSERILRVGGRLNLSQLPYHTKHPALLPINHPFTRIVAQYYHLKLLHGGGRHLLATIRQEFWPLNGRRLVRSIVRNCFRCTRLNPEPVQQQIGQLPAQRVVPGRPFEVTGVDYAGPLYLKPAHFRAPALKAYICIFVCFTTKGVHIELASDLSTHTFLNALRRFIARRGKPAHLHSDNGKNFEGAKNELIELYRMLNNTKNRDQIENVCASEGIQWHLTPPKAPHFGGLWEAAVKVAKKHLFRQLGPTKQSFEDMATVLAEIESIMNSRPLLPITDDPEDLDILTPSHFLIGTTATALPDPDVSTVPVNRLTHYQQLQQHVQQFWVRWRDEYLAELQRDSRHRSRNNEITPGRMVIVVDELQAPLRWPLARITAVRPGKDNIVRVVSLRTAKGIITRPVTKICLLPFSAATTDAEGCPATSNQSAEEIAANLV